MLPLPIQLIFLIFKPSKKNENTHVKKIETSWLSPNDKTYAHLRNTATPVALLYFFVHDQGLLQSI
jgi:hypothetical protein